MVRWRSSELTISVCLLPTQRIPPPLVLLHIERRWIARNVLQQSRFHRYCCDTVSTQQSILIGEKWSRIAALAGDTYSVRWTGFVQPHFSQTYTFRTNTDDGVRLWVNGVQIINRWINLAGISTGTITLLQVRSIRSSWNSTKSRTERNAFSSGPVLVRLCR